MKQSLTNEEFEQKGQTLAQLADGKATQFALEYEHLFHSKANQLSEHPDWQSLVDNEKQFLLNTLALMIFQGASGFDRRIKSQVESFPIAVLVMGKVRYDLPCPQRKAIATKMLENISGLDVNTLKIFRAFKSDIELASKTGRTGFGFFVFVKALRRLWKGDVRENERLNKQLKLYGDRAPNSSLDLIASRICLKYKLGAKGFSETDFPTTKKPSKSVARNWSNLRSMAAKVFDTCMEHWVDGANEVLSQENRFAEVADTSWCPSKEDVYKWTPKLLGTGDRTTGSQIKRHQVVAAVVNRTLYRFLHHHDHGSGSAPSAPTASTPAAASSSFPEHYFSAVVLVEGTHQNGRPYRLEGEHPVYLFGESVNRSVRLLKATWTDTRIKIDRPWTFIWMADLILNAMSNLQRPSNSKPLTVMVFPIGWLTTMYNNGHVGIEGSCVSKSGTVPFVTITHWEEES